MAAKNRIRVKNERDEALQNAATLWESRYTVFLGAAAIVLLICIVYAPAFNGGFILDDDILLTDSILVKSPDGLYRMWFTTQGTDYWPITNSSFWLEWKVWGANPAGYHVTNIVFFSISCILLWIILRQLALPGAFFAVLLYAVHPVNVESTAWIAQRKDVLSFFFFLWSVYGYLKAESRLGISGERVFPPKTLRWYGFSLGMFVLAMLSKGSVAVFPVLMLLLIAWRRKIDWRDAVRIAPFFVVAAVLAGVNVWFQTHGQEVIRNAGLLERSLGASAAIWFYLYKAFFPLNLTFVYPMWDIQTSNGLWWLPLIGLIALTACLWRFRQGWGRPVWFGWLFFFVALLPVIGLTDVGYFRFSLVADRYLHIAVLGVLVPAAAGWTAWQSRMRSDTLFSGANVAAAVLICVWGILSFRHCDLLQEPIRLYTETLKQNEDCWLANNNLGLIYAKQGKTKEAYASFEKTVEKRPSYAEALCNLAKLSLDAGDQKKALGFLQRAVQYNPKSPRANSSLGIFYQMIDDQNNAAEYFRRAIDLQDTYVDAHVGLGIAYAALGRLQESTEQYDIALKLVPNNALILNNWGSVLEKMDRIPEAIDKFKQAVDAEPNDFLSQFNLGTIYFKVRRVAEASACFREASRIQPGHPYARMRYAGTLRLLGRMPEAVEQLRQAVAINPDVLDLHLAFGSMCAECGREADARTAIEKAKEIARKSGKPETVRQVEEWAATLKLGK